MLTNQSPIGTFNKYQQCNPKFDEKAKKPEKPGQFWKITQATWFQKLLYIYKYLQLYKNI